MKFRKFLTIGIAALTVAAFSFGLAACKPDTEDPGKDPETPGGDTPVAPAEVTVEGGYGYYPPDQGGIGLELNLYEDGTYYYSQFTSVLYSGTYTAEEASGTDEEGNTIHYTVTFDDQVNFGEETHNIVSDADGTVYLTNMYDDMSLLTYNFSKQEDYLEEVVQTVEQFWSSNYAEDFVTATFYSDNSYTLDGINGAGYAGSMGTYTSETAEDGTVTYTMTDGDDSSKVYTITVVGASITLTGTETEYTMTSINPNLVVKVEFTGSNSWGAAVVLTCYDDSSANLQITMEGVMDFADATGTWQYMSDGDYYVFVFGGTVYTAENTDGTYSFSYKINATQFEGEEVTLSYTLEEPLISYSFTYTPVLSYAAGETVNMVCNSVAGAEEYTFTGSIWDGACTFTIVCAADGTCSGTTSYATDEGEGTWSQADGVITIEINGTTYTATAGE